MKNSLYILLISMLFLAGCTGVKSTTSGLENESFIEVVGVPSHYQGGVKVIIDDNTTFHAKVKKDHAKRPKGAVYAISTGTHLVTVIYEDKVVYEKQIFVSSQETKKIVLP